MKKRLFIMVMFVFASVANCQILALIEELWLASVNGGQSESYNSVYDYWFSYTDYDVLNPWFEERLQTTMKDTSFWNSFVKVQCSRTFNPKLEAESRLMFQKGYEVVLNPKTLSEYLGGSRKTDSHGNYDEDRKYYQFLARVADKCGNERAEWLAGCYWYYADMNLTSGAAAIISMEWTEIASQYNKVYKSGNKYYARKSYQTGYPSDDDIPEMKILYTDPNE